MITVIIGGSGSGKSQYAEQLLLHTKAKHLYYLATMEIHGEEEQQKVERHRRMREGKGFVTIEQPRDLSRVEIMWPGEESAVLVECISNLAAGIAPTPLSHAEIQETADKVAPQFKKLVTESILKIGAMLAEEM